MSAFSWFDPRPRAQAELDHLQRVLDGLRALSWDPAPPPVRTWTSCQAAARREMLLWLHHQAARNGPALPPPVAEL